jgi:hypothetical protein
MYRLACVPLTSPADELKLQSLKIDGCSPSSVIKIIFERSFSLSSGPKAVLFRLAIFLLEALLAGTS